MQGELFKRRGGARPGAGRPRITDRRASEHHKVRAKVTRHQPLHVVVRVARDLGSLRSKAAYLAIRTATAQAFGSSAFRIVHLSIQRTHIHLIVEANDRMKLARGMQGFLISAARHLNRALGREGNVFADRYHATALTCPAQVRNTLAYVMNNWRHHHEHLKQYTSEWKVDPFSTATSFEGWSELDGRRFEEVRPSYLPMIVTSAASWLLRIGWKRRGLISFHFVPGGAHAE